MGKLPDWVPDELDMTQALYNATRMAWVDAMNAARAVLALLERKAGEADGKPDPAPVASEILRRGCAICGERGPLNFAGVCVIREQCDKRPRKDG